jgi:hypothetical protein
LAVSLQARLLHEAIVTDGTDQAFAQPTLGGKQQVDPAHVTAQLFEPTMGQEDNDRARRSVRCADGNGDTGDAPLNQIGRAHV